MLGIHFTPGEEIRICTLCVECTPVCDIGLDPLAQCKRGLEDQIDIILHLRARDVNDRVIVLPGYVLIKAQVLQF